MKSQKQMKVLIVLSFPVLLSVGIFLIPVMPDYSDHALAAGGVEQTGRWFVRYILAAMAFGLSVLSSSVIVGALKRKSYVTPSFLLPIIALGV
jgi:hypothetical protein